MFTIQAIKSLQVLQPELQEVLPIVLSPDSKNILMFIGMLVVLFLPTIVTVVSEIAGYGGSRSPR